MTLNIAVQPSTIKDICVDQRPFVTKEICRGNVLTYYYGSLFYVQIEDKPQNTVPYGVVVMGAIAADVNTCARR